MRIITFDAHLIEMNDLVYIQEHIESHQPCIAFFAVTYPSGNTHHFMAAADSPDYVSVSIGKQAYSMALRINGTGPVQEST
jgi:hypothetical protein